ncbi:unnamed protein product [Fusarium graminearum]|uniref:Uncharacterized protein n=1 Tax=Gibberella zeae TaxID=5518 RepID=A0A4E9EF89_GIBZA|nr:unnamed protein product [Fusarium graminearum]CAG1988066.1 unnamed protein product [Fusarium graminearum]CAG2014561.1 unnamed protein product [Fusarium graminearum]
MKQRANRFLNVKSHIIVIFPNVKTVWILLDEFSDSFAGPVDCHGPNVAVGLAPSALFVPHAVELAAAGRRSCVFQTFALPEDVVIAWLGGLVEEGPGAEMAYLRKMEQECEYSRRPSIMWIGSVVSVFLAGLAVVAPAVAVARVVVEVVVAAVTVADAVAVVAGWTR